MRRSISSGGYIKGCAPCVHCGCPWALCDDLSEQCFLCGHTLRYCKSMEVVTLEQEFAARDLCIMEGLKNKVPVRQIADFWGVPLSYIYQLKGNAPLTAFVALG